MDACRMSLSVLTDMAMLVREGSIRCPDVSKMEPCDAQTFLLLITDDKYFDFFNSVKNLPIEYVRALIDYSNAEAELELIEKQYREARSRLFLARKEVEKYRPEEMKDIEKK